MYQQWSLLIPSLVILLGFAGAAVWLGLSGRLGCSSGYLAVMLTWLPSLLEYVIGGEGKMIKIFFFLVLGGVMTMLALLWSLYRLLTSRRIGTEWRWLVGSLLISGASLLAQLMLSFSLLVSREA